jgi:hypothetical protein
VEDNIKMDIQEIGLGGTDWVNLVEDKYQWTSMLNMVMTFWSLQFFFKLFNS